MLFRALQSLFENTPRFIGFTTDLGLLYSQLHLEFVLPTEIRSYCFEIAPHFSA